MKMRRRVLFICFNINVISVISRLNSMDFSQACVAQLRENVDSEHIRNTKSSVILQQFFYMLNVINMLREIYFTRLSSESSQNTY